MDSLRGQPGAIYHRVSIDRQDADRQRQSTRDWLTRHGLSVAPAHVYEDIGWTRADADKRPAFQRLLRDADDGKIKWIVCDALDRFGTKNKHQLVSYLYRLQEADCKLFTVNDKEWTREDLLTLIEAGVEGEKSEGEGRSKSERVIEKARQKAKRGEWLGGKIPYAMEVVAFRLNGDGLEEQWRWRMLGPDRRLKIDIISNSTKEYVGRGNLWLSGLLFCAHCGQPMYGRIEKRTNKAVYYCSTYFTHPKPRSKCPCTINRIEHEKLEEKIQKWLSDTGVDLTTIGTEGRGKRNLPEAFFDASLRMIHAKAQMRERVGLPDPPHVDVEAIMNQFAEVYEQELPQLNDRLKALRDEQRLAIRSLSRLPDEATHAIATAKKEVADLDQRIRNVEAQTVNHAERFMAAMQEIVETLKDWQAARDAMTYETSARRKAEAVRKVLAKMILTFTPTGRKRPTSVLTDWVFVPVGMNGEASPPPRSDSPQLGSQSVNYYRQSGCRCP